MKVELVNFAARNCHEYGPALLYRAVKFSRDNDLDSDPETLYQTMAYEMMRENPDMIVLAAIERKKVVGHLLARVVNIDGTIMILVTQLEIDKKYRDGRQDTILNGFDIIKQFAASKETNKIRCWAMNENVAKIFERLGFKPKSHILMDAVMEEEDG